MVKMTEQEFLECIEFWAGGPLAAKAYFYEHRIPAWGHKTVAELIAEGKPEVMEEIIEAVKSGAFQ